MHFMFSICGRLLISGLVRLFILLFSNSGSCKYAASSRAFHGTNNYLWFTNEILLCFPNYGGFVDKRPVSLN